MGAEHDQVDRRVPRVSDDFLGGAIGCAQDRFDVECASIVWGDNRVELPSAGDIYVAGSILGPNTWVETEAQLVDTLAGRNCHFGRNVEIRDGLFGDKSVVTDYSQT